MTTTPADALLEAWRSEAQARLPEADRPPPPAGSGSLASNANTATTPGAAAAAASEENEQVCELDGTPFSTYYGQLQHQQNMLQDSVRTGMYQYAFAQNAVDFADATVLDVGTGTGVLAFFAVQAGAKKVYGVEQAKRMAEMARKLVKGNNLEGQIEIVESSVEASSLPVDKVDIIVSEPIGFLLVHERMLESFVQARDMYLKPGGLMMPSEGIIEFAPFTDEALWQEQAAKAHFWTQNAFYGMDLSCLKDEAEDEYFGQAVSVC